MDNLDTAIDEITTARALRATQNVSSRSSATANRFREPGRIAQRIMDADYAAETANLTRGQILQQAGTAIWRKRTHCLTAC